MSKHHPSARRVHREANADDKFVSGVLEGSVWARDHGRTIVIATVVALVLVVFGLWYRSNQAAVRDRAAAELSQVRATVQSGNTALAKQDLEAYVKRFGGTPSGEEARLMLAQAHLQSNEAPKAIEILEDMAGDVDSPLGYNAAMLLAAAHETAKKPEDAERVYLRMADGARFGFQKREALDKAARLRMEKGNAAGALELYERLLATYEDEEKNEDTPASDAQEKSMYEMRMAEVRAQVPAKS